MHGNRYIVEEYGKEAANFQLIWPKGDGNCYQMFNLDKVCIEDVKRNISLLKLFTNSFVHGFSLGYLRSAYTTPTNLAIIEFYVEQATN